MNKLPTKQIYLLTIIIVGIIALSVYSTYAIFTFESETSDIVSIHTPKSLKISENIYEYQQLEIEPNTVATTDIDIYNSYEYEICYSVWYKVIGDENIKNNVQIFEISKEGHTSSGTIKESSHLRVTLAIINDNKEKIKINIGTIGTKKEIDSCSLNLTSDKSIIEETYKNIENLSKKLLEEKDKKIEIEESYHVYEGITEILSYEETDEIFLSENFKYHEELFNLEKAEDLTLKEIVDKKLLETKDIYFCKEGTECSILYKIVNLETEEIENENQEKRTIYKITKYDKMIGYSQGTVGLRNINDKDYVYYGDNPNNYIYYNCKNNTDINTCEIWRIIGFFYNQEKEEYYTKIVKNESIGKYEFDKKTNIWKDSSIYKQLNEEYKLINKYDIYTEEYIEKLERIKTLDEEIKNIKTEEEFNSKIKLLNLSDYLYTSICENKKIIEYKKECLTNNWLNNIEIEKEWTLTSKEIVEIIEETIEDLESENSDIEEVENEEVGEEINEEITEPKEVINYVYSIGKQIEENNVTEVLDVRPVVFLKSRMLLLDGKGTKEEPYIVK